jgi:hypothetical protein
MRYLMVWLALVPSCALAQEQFSVDDRACITAAAAKLPQVAALKIEQSRVLPNPSADQNKSKLYRVTVEIDTSLAGQTSTYVFNCVRQGPATIVQPLGMR